VEKFTSKLSAFCHSVAQVHALLTIAAKKDLVIRNCLRIVYVPFGTFFILGAHFFTGHRSMSIYRPTPNNSTDRVLVHYSVGVYACKKCLSFLFCSLVHFLHFPGEIGS
jgi:hypothetical protein